MKNHTHLPSLGDHYSQLLGLVSPWTISDIDLNVDAATLTISVVEIDAASFPCPECGTTSSRYDHATERRWRHLDTMQFTTEIVARLPRIQCKEHGVKTVCVPWAEAGTRWTLLFEAFAIEVMRSTTNLTRAMSLLKIGWDSAHAIRTRAVLRGLGRREDEVIRYAGIDEKSFLKGHKYASLMTDLTKGRVLDVVQGRTKESAELLINTALSDTQRARVEAIAMDMWPAFMKAWQSVSDAPIVHDKFHISGYLGKAVDSVRKKEHRTLRADGDNALTKTKYLWLSDPKNWCKDQKKQFRSLMKDELDVGRAWTLKELFRHFWDFVSVPAAKRFFKKWYFRTTHSRLKPMIKIAKMLKRHLDGLLAHCSHKITNAVTEGLNSKIQVVKASARGFRNFEHYRIAILFFCGKLDMRPL